MSSRQGRWVYNIAGDMAPADAPEDFATKDEAIAAAIATYWPPDERKALREHWAKEGGFPLRFFVGLVHKAKLRPAAGSLLADVFAEAQLETADRPVGWPNVDDKALKELETIASVAFEAWLRVQGQSVDWDAVTYEQVEVMA